MFIFQKWFSIRRANGQTDKFEREFWSGNDLNALYQGAVNNRHTIGSLERVFEAGFREFAKLRGQRGTDPSDMVNGARRAMRATFQREMDFLERHLAFLASTGSVSPYVGLFGTVWASCTPFAASRTFSRRRSRRWRPASPRRSSPRRSACSPPSRRWWRTTATRTTSSASATASRASWRSSPTSSIARR